MVLYTDLLICNKSDRYIQFFWVCCVGLGARLVVNFSGGSLCVWRPPLRYLGYTLEWSLVLEHVCAGGGGNVTFFGIYSFPLYCWCQCGLLDHYR